MRTPLRPTRIIKAQSTFNNKQSHHDLYEILTYNIPEFHKYLKKNINSQINIHEFHKYLKKILIHKLIIHI